MFSLAAYMTIGLYEESRWLKSTLRKMKIREVMGFDRILIEVQKCLGGMGIGWLTNFLNEILSFFFLKKAR